VYSKCITLPVSKWQWTTPSHYCNYRLSSSCPCSLKSGTTVTLVAWMYFMSPARQMNPVTRRCAPLLNDWWAYSWDSWWWHVRYNIYPSDSVMVQTPYLYKQSRVVIKWYYSLVIECVNASDMSYYQDLCFGECGNGFRRCTSHTSLTITLFTNHAPCGVFVVETNCVTEIHTGSSATMWGVVSLTKFNLHRK